MHFPQPTVCGLQQKIAPRLDNERRYKRSNVVNAEAHHSLKYCSWNINDIYDLFATSIYGNPR